MEQKLSEDEIQALKKKVADEYQQKEMRRERNDTSHRWPESPPRQNRAERRAIKAKNKKTLERLRKARAEMNKQVGYRGQDFKVVAAYNGNPDFVVGWTSHPSGGPLFKMAEKHPSMSNVRIIKMSDEEKAALSGQK